MSRIRAKIASFRGWLREHATLIGLVIIEPIFVSVVLSKRLTEDTIGALVLVCCLIVVVLGLDAAIRIRRRRPASKSLRAVHRSLSEDMVDGAMGLLTPLAFMMSIQFTFRKTFVIATDPESSRLLGYIPTDQIVQHVTFGAGIWALVSAYVIKYYWDDLVVTIEDRLKQKGGDGSSPPPPL